MFLVEISGQYNSKSVVLKAHQAAQGMCQVDFGLRWKKMDRPTETAEPVITEKDPNISLNPHG